jgi:nucleotide-binding universal stress UspA family protein
LTGPDITPVQRHTVWLCRRIMIPLDGSAIARQIVYPTVDLARGLGARITLLSVLPAMSLTVGWPAVPFGGSLEPTARQHDAITQLENVAQLLRSARVSVDTRVVQTAQPTHDAILNEAADTHADLIALATRGHGVAKRLAFGSVAHELIKRAAAPMLVLSPPHTGAGAARRSGGEGVEVNHAGH